MTIGKLERMTKRVAKAMDAALPKRARFVANPRIWRDEHGLKVDVPQNARWSASRIGRALVDGMRAYGVYRTVRQAEPLCGALCVQVVTTRLAVRGLAQYDIMTDTMPLRFDVLGLE